MASMYYVVAKIEGYTLLDVDMLPLQGEHWQTDQMVSAYLALVASQFSRPAKLVLALDFMVVGSIFTGLGIKTPSGTRHPASTKFSKCHESEGNVGKDSVTTTFHSLNEYNLFAGSIQ